MFLAIVVFLATRFLFYPQPQPPPSETQIICDTIRIVPDEVRDSLNFLKRKLWDLTHQTPKIDTVVIESTNVIEKIRVVYGQPVGILKVDIDRDRLTILSFEGDTSGIFKKTVARVMNPWAFNIHIGFDKNGQLVIHQKRRLAFGYLDAGISLKRGPYVGAGVFVSRFFARGTVYWSRDGIQYDISIGTHIKF